MAVRFPGREGSTRAINQETNNGIEASNQLDALARKMGSPIRNARYEEGRWKETRRGGK